MTQEQKLEWIKNASNKELLKQLVRSSEWAGKYPVFSDEWKANLNDAQLVEDEILARMGKEA